MKEPTDEALVAARLARAFPALLAYSAAGMAVELCGIERAQRRHAERCCNGEDGGYVRIRPLGNAGGPIVREHDPDAEERAAKRIDAQVDKWTNRLGELLVSAAGRPLPIHIRGNAAGDKRRRGEAMADVRMAVSDVVVDLQGDPRGAVLLLRLPGDAEAVPV